MLCSSLLHTRYSRYHGTKMQNITFANEHGKTKETLMGLMQMADQFMASAERKRWVKEQATTRKEQCLYCDKCAEQHLANE